MDKQYEVVNSCRHGTALHFSSTTDPAQVYEAIVKEQNRPCMNCIRLILDELDVTNRPEPVEEIPIGD